MEGRHFLDDVKAQFLSLNTRGDRIGVRDGFPRAFVDKRYTVLHKNSGRDNHFQGIERIGPLPVGHRQLSLPQAPFRSAGRPARLPGRATPVRGAPISWKTGTRRPRTGWSAISRSTPTTGIPAGSTLSDAVAVVPLERFDNSSVITFLDVSIPAQPVRLRARHRAAEREGRRLAMTALPTAGCCSPSGATATRSANGAPRLSPGPLPLGRGSRVSSGFSMVAQVPASAPTHRFAHEYQSLDFVWASGAAAGGIAVPHRLREHLRNPADAQPARPGQERGPPVRGGPLGAPDWRRRRPIRSRPTASSFRDEREFETSGDWCNMDAGACAYVDSNQQLIVYSVFHFLAKIGGGAVRPRSSSASSSGPPTSRRSP